MSVIVSRREALALIGAAAAPAAFAQQPAVPVIGFLGNTSAEGATGSVRALRQGLAETGFVEGQNLAIEFRFADEQNDRLPALAADLAHRNVAVLAVGGVTALIAAKAATSTIPLVFNIGVDPVELGFVNSLARPGGNITGVGNLNIGLEPKRLEILREVLPKASAFGFLMNPTHPLAAMLGKEMETAAQKLGVTLHIVPTAAASEMDGAFAALAQRQVDGVVIGNDGLTINRREQLGALSLRHRMPAIFHFREFAAAGGLMGYGASLTDPYRLVGVYAGRILKGEKPADLPVQQATKTEMIINLKTAKALGLTFPLPLLGRADEVIE